MLGVTVAEMSTSLARKLKVDFSAFGGGGDVIGGSITGPDAIKALIDATTAAATVLEPAALFLRFAGSDATVRTFITAARTNGLAKVLAEPNLTTISGQDAEFQSGGSFPVPVAQFGSAGGAGGGISVQFYNYGVILKFLPVVLDTHRISLKVNITVSELSNENSVTVPAGATGESFAIPSLIQRSASSSLELDSGQTMGIAGLINDRTRESIKKFPGLGDIPVLGQLFTSQDFVRSETELMIFVTPQLAKPIDPARIKLPTDDFVEPSDTEYYWMGRTEGLRDVPHRPASQQQNYGGMRGHFGPKIQNYRP
jgi:pilus assembly protein CpaC